MDTDLSKPERFLLTNVCVIYFLPVYLVLFLTFAKLRPIIFYTGSTRVIYLTYQHSIIQDIVIVFSPFVWTIV